MPSVALRFKNSRRRTFRIPELMSASDGLHSHDLFILTTSEQLASQTKTHDCHAERQRSMLVFYSPLATRDSSAEFILSKIEGPQNDTCAVIRVFAKAQLQLRKDPSWSEP